MERLYRSGKWPFFVYLLPVFFVLHGFTRNFYLIPLSDSLLLLAKYLFITMIFHAVFFFILRDNARASLVSFVLMAIYFFFGAFHDTIKSILPGTFFPRYIFILPFILFIAVFSFILILRIRNYTRYKVYLNILFFTFIIIDLVILTGKISAYDRRLRSIPREFTLCDTCDKPDIYLVVMDEYAGEKELRDLFNFDNTSFLDELRKRNFNIIKNSTSNYNLTPISIASLLNIDYIKYEGRTLSDIPMSPLYNRIDTNCLVPFFSLLGYEFINNSIFTVNGRPPRAMQMITPVGTMILESQTLINRIQRDIGYHLISWHILKGDRNDDYAIMNNNKEIVKNIKDQALHQGKKPIFSYSHLTMPHFPYYYNSEGKPYPHSEIVEVKENRWHPDRYLEYLRYTNGVIIDLVDFVLNRSPKPPVIIILSDHGFRFYPQKVHEEYDFYNLNATFLPGQYSPKFEENLSNISYMRELLNLLFDQHLKTDKQAKFYIPIVPQQDSRLQ